ncbi:SGNH/GDSL hydrolase family protein [Streptomyces populi]|nr:SGNH/GDSL hydrolase family protein [Streptomyces populi]
MILHQALARCRTLVVEGPDGLDRRVLLAELDRHRFTVRPLHGHLHHVDPTRPYRELLSAPGRLAVDGGLVHELVYGPLRHGRSRVTWIQALDFAEAVAERDGALLHLTGGTDDTEAVRAYERALRTLAQHVPVVTVDTGELARTAHDPVRPIRQLGFRASPLTLT